MSNIRPPSFSKINRPTSPTLSEATTRASMLDLDGKVITRADLRASVQAYETLLSASASYRAALISLSNSTAAFADAIETCSGLKGASFATASRQGAAAGFHHLFANHLHLLSTSIDRKFEKPLAQHLNDYRHVIVERSAAYEKSLRDRSRIIRQTEAENMNIGRRRERNMETFRAALAVLQSQVDEIDRLKVEHYQEIAEHEEETWDFVQGKVAVVVKSTFEVFDRLSSKSTDPILEPMLSSIPDPFDSYGPPKPEGQIFSVLQPLGIMTDPSQPSTPRTSEPDTSIAAPRPSWVNDMGGFLPSNTSTYAEWQNVQSSDYSQRRHSFPASLSTTSESPLSSPPKSPPQRVAESKLRNVLSAIDENRGLNESEPAPDLSTSPSSSELNAQESTEPVEPVPIPGAELSTPRNSFYDPRPSSPSDRPSSFFEGGT